MTQESTGLPMEVLHQLIQATTGLLHQAAPVDVNALLRLVAYETEQQRQYEQVLVDLCDAAKRTSHPYWGFYIEGRSKTGEAVEIARTFVPKVLDTSADDYLAQLAAWTNTYMLVLTPGTRAAWRAVGFVVNFFQAAEAPKPHDAKPKLQLVR